MARFPQLSVAVVSVFVAVLMSLAFCGNLHLNMPLPGMSGPIGCSMSAEDHDALTLTLSGMPGSSGYQFAALIATALVAAALFVLGAPRLLPAVVFRDNITRRDRWLAYLRRGLLNPKTF